MNLSVAIAARKDRIPTYHVRVKKYMHERIADRGGGIEQARKERWRFFCRGHSWRERGIRDYR